VKEDSKHARKKEPEPETETEDEVAATNVHG
jgi:hypothetical protein